MRAATIRWKGEESAAIVLADGWVPVDAINERWGRRWPTDMLDLISTGGFDELHAWYRAEGGERLERERPVPFGEAAYAPLYRHPRKIWGIGLNYVEHAADLAEKAPDDEPASFMKPDTTIIGPGEAIAIPRQSERTTAEAELGIVLGRKCRDVEREDWLSVVAGFTTILDMTAEDILRKNPRFLTRAKSFDTFFSFGPQLVTPDEVADVMKLNVATVINGKVHARNVVSNMTFPPDYLVSFHSRVMTLLPGDIISTGTPKAVHVRGGDVVECRIDGFAALVNPVIDLKERPASPRS
ncbi:MAG TPA: fumarylacetoacetate hydrolase family protein [Syntrophales bacterium]|nr:fumarylacetoacetate hydrolase family protein [Syntrophales bacterium]